jgi:bifunctional non-homologous end joining protein LigD
LKKEAKGGQLAFVVHKHKATSLHYDFRLEIGGVMPSWSVPKGPTLDSGVRRLAMPTSDHMMEYRHFEGVLKGEYGAGPVMIWDEGTYDPEVEVSKGVRREVVERKEAERVAKESLEEGNLKFRLYGKKLKGSFALVRTAGWGGKESWLLIKHRDEYSQPGYDANDYDYSAVSKKTLAQIAGQEELPGSSGGLESEEKEGVADHRRRADGHRAGG